MCTLNPERCCAARWTVGYEPVERERERLADWRCPFIFREQVLPRAVPCLLVVQGLGGHMFYIVYEYTVWVCNLTEDA